MWSLHSSISLEEALLFWEAVLFWVALLFWEAVLFLETFFFVWKPQLNIWKQYRKLYMEMETALQTPAKPLNKPLIKYLRIKNSL